MLNNLLAAVVESELRNFKPPQTVV